MAFRILSLSGGGYLGLYTAAVLTALEEMSGEPLYKRFDLIAGTSVGGIIALGLANQVKASEIMDAFKKHGDKIFSDQPPPQTSVGKKLELLKNATAAKYSNVTLMRLIKDVMGQHTLIKDLKQRIIVPAVNLTKGKPQVFKTPHHRTFVRDLNLNLVDVALATSAAPTYFPLHQIGGELFADGGLYANSPDDLAIHEAEHFLGQRREDIYLLSIGTTTSHFSFSNSIGTDLGWMGWMNNQRLTSVMIGVQQSNTDYVVRHKLGDRYIRIDQVQSAEQERYLALDVATSGAIGDLEGLAESSIRAITADPNLRGFLEHNANIQNFN